MPPSIYPLFDQLSRSLGDEASVMGRLTTFLNAERDLLIRGELPAFVESISEKGRLQKEFQTAAKTRQKAIAAVCEALQIDREDIKRKDLVLTHLAEDQDRASCMASVLEEYEAAARKLAGAGLRTQDLLNKSIEFTDHMIKMMASVAEAPSTYSRKGRLSVSSQTPGSALSTQF